ncbi:hypothetical protein TRSC58_05193 [Trypanosoma rangeli SC58]|uniref:Uncharacterized protein n=1 Tax=Trypanosoma rangeli SC58 TaxID=429131 RepID=A0A061IWT5_TRYRA|nr:hypothetical protein TRSC58_05193 [Trypanosoma rangeli SC58]
MVGAGGSGNHSGGHESMNITKWSLIILVALGTLVLSFFVACVWFNFHWMRGVLGGMSIVHPRLQLHSNTPAQQDQAPFGESEPETLQGHALENRVRARRHRGPYSYHLPDGHTTVHIDDFSTLPEAKPPPPTEEEMQRWREEAERVPSPVFYGRGSYFCHSVSSLFGSFRIQTTPRTPAAVSGGSRTFSAPNRRASKRGGGNNTSQTGNDTTNTLPGCTDHPQIDKAL